VHQIRLMQVPSKSHKTRRTPLDINTLRSQLRSGDEQVRPRALHRVCPCGSGFSFYEQLLDDLKLSQKDPSLEVRHMARHVEEDALTIELIETNLDRDAEAGRRGSDADWDH
jgi:hypothetical protein